MIADDLATDPEDAPASSIPDATTVTSNVQDAPRDSSGVFGKSKSSWFSTGHKKTKGPTREISEALPTPGVAGPLAAGATTAVAGALQTSSSSMDAPEEEFSMPEFDVSEEAVDPGTTRRKDVPSFRWPAGSKLPSGCQKLDGSRVPEGGEPQPDLSLIHI